MDKLRKYLEGRSKAAFAASIGTSPSYLSQLLSGRRKPGIKLMTRIMSETGGLVDFNSWHRVDDAASAEARQ